MWRRSSCRWGAAFSPFITDIYTLPGREPGEQVTLRARIGNSRVKGKVGFLHLRQPPNSTVQAVIPNSPELLALAKGLTKESVVEVSGKIQRPEQPVASASCSNVEILASDLKVISAAAAPLPFPLNDPTTKLDTRLDHRSYDLRTLQNAAIFRLQSEATQLYRRFMTQRGFIEIHSPKLIGTPSEGGSAVFRLEYFERPAYLAQSPQLYKQMAVQGDLGRVIEIGPVFRAENSQTHRHLTEYVGLDAEMIIQDSYYEVLDELEAVVVYMLTSLMVEHSQWIFAATTSVGEAGPSSSPQSNEHPPPSTSTFSPVVCTVPPEIVESLQLGDDTNNLPSQDEFGGRISNSENAVLRLTFDNALKLLKAHGVKGVDDIDDLSSAQERRLGELVKARYGVDLYVVDRYRLSARPFYTMPEGERHSRSFDMFLRGEEICSGAQRVHDPSLLLERAKLCRVSEDLIADYVNAFRYGAWPHGGFGLGLERLVMFLLGLPNVRQTSLFPRDPRRLTP